MSSLRHRSEASRLVATLKQTWAETWAGIFPAFPQMAKTVEGQKLNERLARSSLCRQSQLTGERGLFGKSIIEIPRLFSKARVLGFQLSSFRVIGFPGTGRVHRSFIRSTATRNRRDRLVVALLCFVPSLLQPSLHLLVHVSIASASRIILFAVFISHLPKR